MKPFAVFKAGMHTSANGVTKTYTNEDIDKSCKLYNEQDKASYHEAPLVVGHPKTNAPAFGWVKRFYREGDYMMAEPKEVNKDFEEAVKDGLYKKRSISFYPSGLPRHVGFLGAMPPAVKGLPGVEFSEDNEECFEFADTELYWASKSKFYTIGEIFRQIKNWLIGEKGLEEAENIIKEWNIKAVEEPLPEPKPIETETISAYAEDDKNKEDKMELEELQKQNAEFAEQNEQLRKQIAELQAKEKQSRKADFIAFCESLTKEGKLTPAQKDKVLDFAEIMDNAGNFDFAEGETKVSKSALQEFKGFLQGLPKQVEFSEVANNKTVNENASQSAGGLDSYDFGENTEVDTDRAELDKKVKKIMKDKGLTYQEALKIAIKEDK